MLLTFMVRHQYNLNGKCTYSISGYEFFTHPKPVISRALLFFFFILLDSVTFRPCLLCGAVTLHYWLGSKQTFNKIFKKYSMSKQTIIGSHYQIFTFIPLICVRFNANSIWSYLCAYFAKIHGNSSEYCNSMWIFDTYYVFFYISFVSLIIFTRKNECKLPDLHILSPPTHQFVKKSTSQ